MNATCEQAKPGFGAVELGSNDDVRALANSGLQQTKASLALSPRG
jgi:hypothetical protein